MPKYDYRCSACSRVYEKREGFDAPVLQQCPHCQGEARRVLTPPAIVFKGSGWYKTDSRGGEPVTGSAASSPTPPTADASTKSEAPAESPASAAAD